MNLRVKLAAAFGLFLFIGIGGLLFLGMPSEAHTNSLEKRFDAISVGEKPKAAEATGDYAVDKAHSYIGFRVRHMGLVDVPGSFNDFQGVVKFDSSKIKNSSVEFTVQVKSVDTRINGRDNHLRSKDFFMVEKYPTMSFKSTRIKKKGKKYRVYGNLTMKGVTKEVIIPFRLHGPIKDRRGNLKMGIQGETTINRRDFNVNYGSNLPSGIPMISDQVKIDLQLETVLRRKKG